MPKYFPETKINEKRNQNKMFQSLNLKEKKKYLLNSYFKNLF
jgi:hypothetical protein